MWNYFGVLFKPFWQNGKESKERETRLEGSRRKENEKILLDFGTKPRGPRGKQEREKKALSIFFALALPLAGSILLAEMMP